MSLTGINEDDVLDSGLPSVQGVAEEEGDSLHPDLWMGRCTNVEFS